MLSVTWQERVLEGGAFGQEGIPEAFLRTTKPSQSLGEDASLSVQCVEV